MQRVALFVDVQNIYYTTREIYGRYFDYRAFWKTVTNDRVVVAAHADAIARGAPKQRGFQQALRDIGFEVKLKPFLQRRDGSAKGDWDVGITLDVVETAPDVDVVVLASGDGDFDMLLERIHQRHGVTTEAYGVAELSAASLKQAATRFVPIDEKLLLEK